MKVKTSELQGKALDWAVAKCEGYTPINHSRLAVVMVERKNLRGIMQCAYISSLRYSSDWAQGGPIIDREWICPDRLLSGLWLAAKRNNEGDSMLFAMTGETPLIATMRCYVASKLGEEVEVPEELL